MLINCKNRGIAAVAFVLTAALLSIVNSVPENPLLLAERLFPGIGGWLQVGGVSLYSGFLCYKMAGREERKKWRLRAWTLFSLFFYGQLILGLTADSLFLLTGKLHLPIPAMILAAPVYRFSSWFMIILFLSTILLTGPAWCSQLCYFGAADANAASIGSKKRRGFLKSAAFKHKLKIKPVVLLTMVLAALVLRITGTGSSIATLCGLAAGVLGLLLVVFATTRNGMMINCTLYCPIGTIVGYAKKISPFRFVVNDNCTGCNACIPNCSYMALTPESLSKKKTGATCTYCGDCLVACRHNGLEYRFAWLDPKNAERLWIVATVVLHSVFLAVARI